MLDLQVFLDLLRTYGFSSTNNYPYIYKKGDMLGLCYEYYDEDYGNLKRVKFFESKDALEDFLKRTIIVKVI